MKQDLFIMGIKKKNNQIYGTASMDEVNELKEEGINTEMIPWVDDKSN